ncbi:MAG: sigma-70 family RNA polymerase sigma factor [Pirellulales bacterium]|nr:sigma-70 family RNA polymerase sigma factor [Pirellulales bacterium]
MRSQPTAEPPSDEQLASRAQQGCSASFEELVRRYQVPLLHFLQRRTAAADAEDLVQDTFVRAYEKLHQYRAGCRFPAWLFTIAHRLSVNRQRRRRPTADSEAVEAARDEAPAPPQLAAEKESRQRLWDLAAKVLSEPQVTAMWLFYVEEMSVQEIARVQSRTRVGVKTMLFRARKKLLPLLQKQESETPDTADCRQQRLGASSCRTAAEVNHG